MIRPVQVPKTSRPAPWLSDRLPHVRSRATIARIFWLCCSRVTVFLLARSAIGQRDEGANSGSHKPETVLI